MKPSNQAYSYVITLPESGGLSSGRAKGQAVWVDAIANHPNVFFLYHRENDKQAMPWMEFATVGYSTHIGLLDLVWEFY